MHPQLPDHPASGYLRLAEGPEDLLDSGPSPARRLLTLGAAVLFLSGTSLFGAAATDLDSKLLADKAVAASGPGKDGHDDDDSSGPGSGDDDDATDDSRSKTERRPGRAAATMTTRPTTAGPRRVRSRGPAATARIPSRMSVATGTPTRAAGGTRPTPGLVTTAPARPTQAAAVPPTIRIRTTAAPATPIRAVAGRAATSRTAPTTLAGITRGARTAHAARSAGSGPGQRAGPAA